MGRKRQNHVSPRLIPAGRQWGADSAYFAFTIFPFEWERFPGRLDGLDLQAEHPAVAGGFFPDAAS